MTTKPHRIHKLSGLLSVSRRRGSETQQCAWTTLGILGKAAHTLFICFLQLGSAQDVVYLMCVCQCREPPSAAIPTECVCVCVRPWTRMQQWGRRSVSLRNSSSTHTHMQCTVCFPDGSPCPPPAVDPMSQPRRETVRKEMSAGNK